MRKLAQYLIKLVTDPQLHAERTNSKNKLIIEAMIEKYSQGLPGVLTSRVALTPNANDGLDQVVLLTGSTGALGSHLLASLLQDKTVKRVYALNRLSASSPTVGRQKIGFVDQGLDTELLSSNKLVFIDGDISKTNMELEVEVYNEVR